MEYLRSGDGVDILRGIVRCDQTLIAGHVREDSKFDLGVIGIHEYPVFPGDKYFSDGPSQLHAHRNILQVRISAAEPSGGGDGLMELSVNSAIALNKSSKTHRVSGL